MHLSLIENIALSLLVLLLPSQLGFHFWPNWTFINGIRIDYLSPVIYAVDIPLLVLLLIQPIRLLALAQRRKDRFLHPRLLLLLASLLLFASLNISVSGSPFLATTKWLYAGKLLLFAHYISNHEFSVKVISLILPLSLIWSSLLGLSQFHFQRSLGGGWYWLGERSFSSTTPGIALGNYPLRPLSRLEFTTKLRPYSTFSHPNSLAGFLLVAIILIWKNKTWLSHLAIALASLTLIISLSKTAIIIGVGLLFYHLFTAKIRIGNRIPAWIIMLFSILIIFLSTLQATSLSANESIAKRLNLIAPTVRIIRSSPFLGVGAGGFIPALFRCCAVLGPGFDLFLQPVHNIYLLTASELGVPFLLAVLLMAHRQAALLQSSRNQTLLFAVAAIFLTGFLDHYWFTLPQNNLLLSLVIGMVWSENSGRLTI